MYTIYYFIYIYFFLTKLSILLRIAITYLYLTEFYFIKSFNEPDLQCNFSNELIFIITLRFSSSHLPLIIFIDLSLKF